MKLRLNQLAIVAVIGFLFMAAVPKANATVELKLSDGITSLDILDNGVGDSDLSNDSINWSGLLGRWNVTVTSVLTNHPGNPTIMDIAVQVRSAASGLTGTTFTATASDDTFSPASTGIFYDISQTYHPGAPATVTHTAWGGLSNTKFDMSNLIGTQAYSASGSTTIQNNFYSVNPYAVTMQVQIAAGTGGMGTSSLDDALTPINVPEPAVVTMLGGVLMFTIGAIRRKARRA